MQSRLVASAAAPETTSADDDGDPPDGDDGVVWRTADQLDADDGEKLRAVVGGSGDERNRHRHDDDDDDDDEDEGEVTRKMPAAAMVGGSHPRTRGGGSRVMIPPPPPPPTQTQTQTTRTTMRPPTGQSSSRAKDDTDAPRRAGGSLGARERPGGRGGRRGGDVGRSPSTSSSSVEAELRRALIRDPLRSLPPRFLRHLCMEVANRFFASSSCSWASLVVILAALGLALVATGLAGLGGPLARASSRAAASILAVTLSESVWPAARSLISVVAMVVGVAWIFLWARAGGGGSAKNEEKEATTTASPLASSSSRVPSASVVIPWTVAITSPSSCEALVVVLSLLALFTTIGIPRDGNAAAGREGECPSVPGINDNDAGGTHYCSSDGGVGSFEELDPSSSSSSSSSLAGVAVVAFLVAAANVLVVSVAADRLERCRNRLESPDDDAGKSNDSSGHSMAETSSVSSSVALVLRETCGRIRRHVFACHAISVLALAALSASLVLIRALLGYFREEGMNVIFAMGTATRHIVYIALGIFILVSLWNSTIEAVATTGGNCGMISFGEISRFALKRSIVEVSSNAVWSTDDTGSGLLGILSDDDGALRYAVLEWIVDRWTAASPAPSERSVPSERTASSHPDDDDPLPAAAMGGKENDSKNGPTSNTFHDGNRPSSDPGPPWGRTASDGSNTAANGGTAAGDRQSGIPSYQSLHRVIAKLDADESLIPTIERYRQWVYSLPPSHNAAMCVALWKMCPATAVFAGAVLWCVARSVIGRSLACLLWCVRSSPRFASTTTNDNGCTILGFVIVVLSPVMLLEYHRVQMWWTRTANYVRSMEVEAQSSDGRIMQRDLAMNLMTADLAEFASQRVANANFLVDTSSLLLRVWLLLVESTSVLEAAVPVVRCATITCAAADLTADTMSLVDLALEVKKRGVVCGIGMIVWDFFCYHLSRELEQRKREADGDSRSTDQARKGHHDDGGEELGGQYTGAAVSAVANFGKLSHNLSCLMEKKKSEDYDGRRSDGGDDLDVNDEPTKCRPGTEPPNRDVSQGGVRKSEVPSLGENKQCDPPDASLEQEEDFQENSEEKQNDNDGLLFLIGGGIALAGAVAGLALHGATGKCNQARKDSEKDSS